MTNLANIAIILDRPQMGENIGAAARVMKNFGLTDLRLVNPRDGWPNKKAEDMSANAIDIIQKSQVFESFEEAIGDRNIIYATTSASRDMEKISITPKIMSEEIYAAKEQKIGVVFGCERTGLENREISFCNKIVYIPVDAAYNSMNLAQAICVICYEIFQKTADDSIKNLQNSSSETADKNEINALFNFLENELENANFFQVAEKKPKMMVNIRNMFSRISFSGQELRTFRGILNALKNGKR